jgi:hypothetical protein
MNLTILIIILGAGGALLNCIVMVSSLLNLGNKRPEQKSPIDDPTEETIDVEKKMMEVQAFIEECLNSIGTSERQRFVKKLRELAEDTNASGDR